MVTTRFGRVLPWGALFVALLVTSCPLPPGTPPPYDVTDLVFSANTVQIIPDAAHPDPADIERVGVVVTGRDAEGILRRPLAIQTLTSGGSTWEAVIPDLPMGPQLAFEVTAYGSPPEESELFRGAAQTELDGHGGHITIPLTPVPGPGGNLTPPIIECITRPAQVECGSESEVTVTIGASRRERIEVSVMSSGGSFEPAAGTVVANRWGRVTVTTRYTAPSSPGAFVHRIRVRDSEGTVVETHFSIIVAYADADAGVSASFSPSITSLSASRDGNTVMWEATATDDGPQEDLSHRWAFTQNGGTVGAHFSDPLANFGQLTGYDETVFGTVSLTVSDGDGHATTISFELVAGQFADEVDAAW